MYNDLMIFGYLPVAVFGSSCPMSLTVINAKFLCALQTLATGITHQNSAFIHPFNDFRGQKLGLFSI